ncbi:hypothetical protein BGZ95_003135 [Linnemannia exigua]|uniref:Uncharacterized protein n=1 Tax=Linnemannia exigua TaxID=604196 RepID=A0AAD4DLT8_9FUNG|nr:hypothetical protein BGZ95_003135 [Linnemannia exigua]
MPTPIFAAGPSFIHLDTWDSPAAKDSSPRPASRSLRTHRATATASSPSSNTHNNTNSTNNNSTNNNNNNNNNNNYNNHDSIEHTTLFLKRFTLTSDNHHRSSSSSSNRRRGRSGTSRMRGKHGFVKALHTHSGAALVDNHPLSKEARSAQFKTYVQSRRLRLGQRNHHHLHPEQQDVRLLDSSDMSLDESEVQDEDEDDNDDDEEVRNHVLDLNPEQYRHYMWELEQRLLERTESAAKSRSSFLMERRLSAGERLHHVQRVVQQKRTEQEMRQHKARDELEQKMVRAMARRNAYLEAAIENDPSRRFRRKGASSSSASLQSSSASSAVASHKVKSSKTGSIASPTSTAVTTASYALNESTVAPLSAAKRGAMSPSSEVRSKLKKDYVRSSKDSNNSNAISNNKYSSKIQTDHDGLHGQRFPKNSPFNMTPNRKAHLTNMTSSSSSTMTMSPSLVENAEGSLIGTFQDISKEAGVRGRVAVASSPFDPDVGGGRSKERLEMMALWAQRRIRQRLVQKASREYMRAIGGSHQRVVGLKFEELARLLHTNKALIQATIKLLRYSSQLAQMDKPPSARSKRVFKNPARVFLSLYMVLAHPSQIRSPSEASPGLLLK